MKKHITSGYSFLLTILLLGMAHLKVQPPMLLLERFFPGFGWFEVFLLAIYAAFLTAKMKNPKEVARWRKISWLIFSAVFFSQLFLGILADERFLMTGKLHLPVPAMIISGSIYRMKISFMPVLFLSTILLTGPAWCSQLCYFGALDNWAADRKKLRNAPIKNKFAYRHTILAAVILITIMLRVAGIKSLYAALFGLLFGIIGVGIIVVFSRKRNKMVHCVAYCPIGTITSWLKYISPFRMSITSSCTTCMACSLKCKYDALNFENIKARKPGITCTYCGECLAACHEKAIRYHFLGLNAEKARNLYLILTISIHAAFIGLGRI
ncbi:MAG: 4Fe-4S binding protein [Bacteroidales bacterium]|nr:4Fe-4S binding protein [Bacteroidales bacterium]